MADDFFKKWNADSIQKYDEQYNKDLDEYYEKFKKRCERSVESIKADPDISSEEKERIYKLMTTYRDSHDQIKKLESMDIDLNARDGVSKAEKIQERIGKLSEKLLEIIGELVDYFDIDDDVELIEITATQSKTLNQRLTNHVNNQLRDPNGDWKRMDKQQLEELMKDLPEEELKQLPGPSTSAFPLFIDSINKQICVPQFNTWSISNTLVKHKIIDEERLDEDFEENQKRLRLELAETYIPAWEADNANEQKEEDEASSVYSSEAEDEDQELEEIEEDDVEPDTAKNNTEPPIPDISSSTQFANDVQMEEHEPSSTVADDLLDITVEERQIADDPQNYADSDDDIEILEVIPPTNSSNSRRPQGEGTSITETAESEDMFSPNVDFRALLDRYQRDTEDLMRMVQEFTNDDAIELSSSSEDEQPAQERRFSNEQRAEPSRPNMRLESDQNDVSSTSAWTFVEKNNLNGEEEGN